ncbi:MAG TPA: DUF2586 family protein [Crocinitomicaceae bacterium]|nr:DUF2586 family protein [Crocinitomicaceae bacterium]
MSNLKGVIIQKGAVGVSVTPPDTSVSLLVICGMWLQSESESANPEYVDVLHDDSRQYTFTSVKQAEAIGITKENDFKHGLHVHRHISEFFRMAGNGTKLYVLMFKDSLKINLTTGLPNLKAAILDYTKGDVRQVGLIDNLHGENVAPVWTLIDGITTETKACMTAVADLYQWAYEKDIPFSVMLGGGNFEPLSATAYNMRDEAVSLNCSGLSVMICREKKYYEDFADNATIGANNTVFADIGTALGVMARAEINQNIGDNEAFNLTDVVKGAWEEAVFLQGSPIMSNLYIQDWEDFGYIFAVKYSGLNGWRFNGDHNCTPIVIDADGNMNEHTIAYTRTMNEASRLLRKVLIPKVKTRQPVDPTTGKLPAGVVKTFDNLGDGVFADMVNRKHISAGKTFTDPNSDLLVEKVLNVEWSLVPYGSVGEIKGLLNLKNKI